MKIVHIARTHRWDDTRIYRKECRSLAEAGHDVYILTSDRSGKAENDVCDGVHFVIVPTHKGNRAYALIKYLWDVLNAAKELNADVYHIHEFFLIFLCKDLSKVAKVIFDSHEDFPKQVFFDSKLSKKRNARREKLAKLLLKYNIQHCSALVAATDEIAASFAELNLPVTTLYNYPDLTEFVHEEEAVESGVEESSDKQYFCYVGGISRDRGIDNILKAIEKVSSEKLSLQLAGPLTEKYAQHLSDLVGWKNVEYLGYADSKMKFDIYEKSIAGFVTLLPIERYVVALPVKLFEYMAAGIPVIASDFPIIKKIVEVEKCGICVNPEDEQGIADAIQYFVDNPKEAKIMGQNGKQAVWEKYNWACENTKLLKLYEFLSTKKRV